MPANEVRAAAVLAGDAVRDGVRRVEGVHRAVVGRWWSVAGPLGRPGRRLSDLVAGAAYGTVGAGVGAAATAAATVLGGVAGAARWRPLSASRAGSTLLAVLNGFAGDRLAQEASPLAIDMAFRQDGRDLPLDPEGLREALPGATGDVAVFVHGLLETDRSWWRGAEPYGARLRDDAGVTPLYLRYNTGLAVGGNGRRLAELLDDVVAAWPVPVARLHLVGHSMGGLVIRSACHAGERDGRAWVPLVRHAVYLGTPHLGAPLARGAVALGSALARVPELRPFATLLARPSAGIGDLRHGSLVAPDVNGEQPEAWFGDRSADVPLLAGCRHHAVSAALAGGGRWPLDRVVGDLLVQTSSATGRGRRRRLDFVAEECLTVAGAHHFSLLGHPAVYEQLREWLAPG